MSHYTRGATFERKVKKYYEDQGWFCIRAAGSHGVADVVAIKGFEYLSTHILLISCRINSKWSKSEWEDLRQTARSIHAKPVLAFRSKTEPLLTADCPPWDPNGKHKKP